MALFLKSVPVLCYHKVSDKSDITAEDFRKHMQLLAEHNYTPITAMHLFNFMRGEAAVPSKPVVLTFDDCHLDNWVNVMPILAEFGFQGVFFCVTGFLHDTPRRPQDAGNPEIKIEDMTTTYINAFREKDYSQFMSRDEVYDTVHRFGHEVYSHSVSHKAIFRNTKLKGMHPDKTHWSLYHLYDEVTEGTKLYERGSALAYNGYVPAGDELRLRNMDERARFCRVEMAKSKSELEYLLSKPCNFFCWPFGDFDRLSMQILTETGYIGSFTLERGANCKNGDPLHINRFEVKKHMTPEELSKKLKIYSNSFLANLFGKRFKLKD